MVPDHLVDSLISESFLLTLTKPYGIMERKTERIDSMVVRNFWIEGEIDGHKMGISGGPRSKDGGFSLSVHQRSQGDIDRRVIDIYGIAKDGKLYLEVYNHQGNKIFEYVTER